MTLRDCRFAAPVLTLCIDNLPLWRPLERIWSGLVPQRSASQQNLEARHNGTVADYHHPANRLPLRVASVIMST